MFQPGDLALEGLDLLPAVKRSPVVDPQASNKALLGLVDDGVVVVELLAPLQLGLEVGDFLGDGGV